MLILGIGDHVDCGSALLENGRVIAAINDERLVREKMVFGVPRESVSTLLERHQISPAKIDRIAVGTERQHLIDGYVDFKDGWFGLRRGKYKQALFDAASRVSKYRAYMPFLDSVYYTLRQPAFRKRRTALQEIFSSEFGFSCPVHFMNHHLCHAASAYYASGFRDATVFSLDGGGDGESGRVYDVVNGKFEKLASVPSFSSLGNFYSYITELCGFKGGRHEGKITGLAAYGEPKYIPQLRQLMMERDGRIENVGNVFFDSALRKLEEILPPDFRHRDLAASVQTYTEQMVVAFVGHWLKRTQRPHVALAGGLLANVKINQRIHEIPGVEAVYVFPGMSDAGIPAGAALALFHQLSPAGYDPAHRAMEHVYLGPEYSDTEIETVVRRHHLDAERFDDVEEEIARLLTRNQVVARFNGRMEFGPRSLGNRSILYPATDHSVQYWLNNALARTEFMPFAPVVMADHAEKCFENLHGAEDTARFMTITFQCTDWFAENFPGVTHVDKTARPQLVSERDNPSLYRILAEYYKLTGQPCLINTSFNMHEEPIVCTPEEAVESFLLGRLDYLAIGNWIARNPAPAERSTDSKKFDRHMDGEGVVRKERRASQPKPRANLSKERIGQL